MPWWAVEAYPPTGSLVGLLGPAEVRALAGVDVAAFGLDGHVAADVKPSARSWFSRGRRGGWLLAREWAS